MRPAHTTTLLRARFADLAIRYRAATAPRTDGLPRVRLMLALPAVLVVLGIALVAAGLNGSSSGAFHAEVEAGRDPSLIAGHPQQIRSDEWNVGTVWTIGQIEQGMPERTETFPGGMDAALPYDLPHRDWSIAFRPHQLGYLFLGVDQGTAWRWWSMGFALIAAAYCFALTMLPRRPIASALLAVGFFFSPFFQWWYQSTTFWPAVWALVTLAAVVWSVRSRSRRAGWLWAPLVAYATTVMAMGIYVPFIVPVALVVLFFAAGFVVNELRSGRRLADLLARIAPTLVAGLASVAVTALWLASKSETVRGFLGTVYPGARLTPAGSGGALSATRAIGSSFADSLKNAGGFLGVNSSEGATFLLVGAFLVPVVVWAVVRQRRAGATLPWVLIALVAVLALFAAFTLVPGWDALARLLLLDRTTAERAKIGVGLASFALVVGVVRYLDDTGARPGRALSGATAGAFLLGQVAIAAAVVVVLGGDKLWGSAPLWWLAALVSAAAVWLFARHRVAAGTAAFLAVSLAGGLGVNPLYVGVYDLRDTAASKAVAELDAGQHGRWLGIGGLLVSATLVESGVEAFNGTQGAPAVAMWKLIDPAHRYEEQWNRIGGVRWTLGAGEPVVSNPAPDQISATFDACSAFAQSEVDFVLSDERMPGACLARESSSDTAHAPLVIYRVVAP